MQKASQSSLLSVLALVSACAGALPDAPPVAGSDRPQEPQPVVENLCGATIPLSTVDPNDPLDDLQLVPQLANRRVIAIGESTHGTSEFVQFRHRLFRYLAEQHGYRVFAMELPYSTGVKLNRYVHGEDVDVYDVLATSYFFVPSEEMKATVEWMRAYNATRPRSDRVEILGVDNQGPRDAALLVADILASRLELSKEETAILAALGDERTWENPPASEQVELVDSLRLKLETVDPQGPWVREAQGALNVLTQNFQIGRVCGHGSRSAPCRAQGRDAGMAANALWQLQQSDTPMLIAAHNAHVSKLRHQDGWEPMGFHLAEALGSSYMAIAMDFGYGGLITRPNGVGQVGTTTGHRTGIPVLGIYSMGPPETGLPKLFLDIGADQFYLPFNEIERNSACRSLFARETALHHYGSMPPTGFHDRDLDGKRPLYRDFDGLVFVSKAAPLKMVQPRGGPSR